MQPATVQLCEDPRSGAETIQYERGPGCLPAFYTARRMDVGLSTLALRPGYAATLGFSTSNLYLGLGGWLGPDGGGFDLFKAGVSVGQTLRGSWATPLTLGFTTLMFDQVHGTRRWGLFAPFAEFALLVGRRDIMVGPSIGIQYRWMFGSPDETQLTLGCILSVQIDERVWTSTAP